MPARRRAARLARYVLAALALAAMMAAPAAAATAPSLARQQRTPAASGSASSTPRSLRRTIPRVYIVDHLAPGTVIERRIEVSNTTDSTAHVVLYPAAASISNGEFLGSEGQTRNELSTWTAVAPAETDVPAGASVTATVTITVPGDAAPGEQYGVVWAEARSAPAAGGVTQVSRVGIRLYVSVGPDGPPAADLTIDSLTAARSPEGQPMVLATVRNTGGRALDMNGTLQLLGGGPGGLSAGPFPATLGSTLRVGETGPVTIALDDQLPAGPWDAQITLGSGLLERSAEASLTFPDTGAATAVDTTSRPWWLYPAIGGLVILLLGAVALLVTLKRRQHRATGVPVPDRAREPLTTP